MSEEKLIAVDDVQIIRGCPFPGGFFSAKNIEDTMDYVPKDDDVIIASYPKTGTTWMQYIILQILSRGESFPTFDDVTYTVIPFMEMVGTAAVDAIETRPRIYKHHLAYDMVQKNPRSKYIYIYRHPEDTLVSFYHFTNNLRMTPSPFDQSEFDQFFEAYLAGRVGYGSYFKHVLSFYEDREDQNMLLVSYEKLHADRRGGILRIAKFLGQEHYDCLTEDESILEKVVEHTSFEYMKKNLHLTHPKHKLEGGDSSAEMPRINFFRKGIVGDGKNTLTDEQRRRMKETARIVLKGTSVIDDWYPK